MKKFIYFVAFQYCTASGYAFHNMEVSSDMEIKHIADIRELETSIRANSYNKFNVSAIINYQLLRILE